MLRIGAESREEHSKPHFLRIRAMEEAMVNGLGMDQIEGTSVNSCDAYPTQLVVGRESV